jgi:hypothetical protein
MTTNNKVQLRQAKQLANVFKSYRPKGNIEDLKNDRDFNKLAKRVWDNYDPKSDVEKWDWNVEDI